MLSVEAMDYDWEPIAEEVVAVHQNYPRKIHREECVQQLVVEAQLPEQLENIETNSKDKLFYGINDDDDGSDNYFPLPSNWFMSPPPPLC